MPNTIPELARLTRRQLVTRTRSDETVYVALRDDAPEWMTDLCYKAHDTGGEFPMMPDDWRFEFIAAALDALAEPDADASRDGIEDEARSALDADVDVMNADLCRWLASNAIRHAYVDEAMDEYGCGWPDRGIMQAIQLGQLREREEVLQLVLAELAEIIDANAPGVECECCGDEVAEQDAIEGEFCSVECCEQHGEDHGHTTPGAAR